MGFNADRDYILIDDAANHDFGIKLEELRGFVNSRLSSTASGAAFIPDGTPSGSNVPLELELMAPAKVLVGSPER